MQQIRRSVQTVGPIVRQMTVGGSTLSPLSISTEIPTDMFNNLVSVTIIISVILSVQNILFYCSLIWDKSVYRRRAFTFQTVWPCTICISKFQLETLLAIWDTQGANQCGICYCCLNFCQISQTFQPMLLRQLNVTVSLEIGCRIKWGTKCFHRNNYCCIYAEKLVYWLIIKVIFMNDAWVLWWEQNEAAAETTTEVKCTNRYWNITHFLISRGSNCNNIVSLLFPTTHCNYGIYFSFTQYDMLSQCRFNAGSASVTLPQPTATLISASLNCLECCRSRSVDEVSQKNARLCCFDAGPLTSTAGQHQNNIVLCVKMVGESRLFRVLYFSSACQDYISSLTARPCHTLLSVTNSLRLSHQKQHTFNRCWLNAGPTSQRAGQHYTSSGSTYCICIMWNWNDLDNAALILFMVGLK